jgi:hypothetical protein
MTIHTIKSFKLSFHDGESQETTETHYSTYDKAKTQFDLLVKDRKAYIESNNMCTEEGYKESTSGHFDKRYISDGVKLTWTKKSNKPGYFFWIKDYYYIKEDVYEREVL